MEYTIFIIITLLIIIYIYVKVNVNKSKQSNKISYSILNNNQLTLAMKDILNKYKINEVNDSNYLRFMNGYNDVENELKTIPDNTYQFIAGIKGMDYIVGKNYLWSVLKASKCKLNEILPKTYLLSSPEDIQELMKCKGKIIVFKKNIQRQEGLLLMYTNEITIDKIDNMIKDNFVIAQEYLDNPMTINNLKCNLRIYLLLTLQNNKLSAYVYHDGFMYYSQKPYQFNSKEPEIAITTGLQKDRNVYIKNPLTLQDLKVYLNGKCNGKYKLLFDNINTLLLNVINSVEPVLKGHNGSMNFSLFGVDIQPDPDLNVKLIEINKSPSLDPKDTRDHHLKYTLQKDILSVIGIINESNNFYKLI